MVRLVRNFNCFHAADRHRAPDVSIPGTCLGICPCKRSPEPVSGSRVKDPCLRPCAALPGSEACDKGAQSTLFYSLTQTLHEVLVEAQIMNRVELRAQHFLALIKMMEVANAEMTAGVAVAFRVERAVVVPIAGVAQPHQTTTGEQMGVAGITGRHGTGEHVDAR